VLAPLAEQVEAAAEHVAEVKRLDGAVQEVDKEVLKRGLAKRPRRRPPLRRGRTGTPLGRGARCGAGGVSSRAGESPARRGRRSRGGIGGGRLEEQDEEEDGGVALEGKLTFQSVSL
jgi:hypothetical protein